MTTFSMLNRYKSDLEKLTKLGETLVWGLRIQLWERDDKSTEELKEKTKKFKGAFEKNYQNWYTEAHEVIRQITPHRLTEFEELYKGPGKRRSIDSDTYYIQDWLNGVRAFEDEFAKKTFDDFAIVFSHFNTQKQILSSVQGRFESSLFDIRQLVQADLFDSELDAARELARHGFSRAAGAVSGVVLERHLGQVSETHEVKTVKKHPTISDLNDILKKADVLETPTWRQIQRLGDLRNLCDHNKDREPTREEVSELIDGVDKMTKTLF